MNRGQINLLNEIIEEDVQRRKERLEEFESWVSTGGPEPCHKAIDDYWNGR